MKNLKNSIIDITLGEVQTVLFRTMLNAKDKRTVYLARFGSNLINEYQKSNQK